MRANQTNSGHLQLFLLLDLFILGPHLCRKNLNKAISVLLVKLIK